MPDLPLAQLTPAELEFLRGAIVKRRLATPITALGLEAIGKGKLAAKLGPLAGASEPVALALLDLALAAGSPAKPGPAHVAPILVWTSPHVQPSPARATTAVVLDLLGSARERVLVVGYEFDNGPVIFGALHKVMAEHGVKARFVIDVKPAPSPKANLASHLALATHHFLKKNWPFGEPLPELYYFPAGCEHGSRRSMHAKCVIVDARRVLIGSANFTRRGHTRNVEVGVCLEDKELAAAVVHQFERLVEAGDLAALPVATGGREAPPLDIEDEADAAPAQPPPPDKLAALAADLMVSEAATPLFLRLLERGAPVPQVGEDVEGDEGEVIGSPELSWDEARVAVLLPEQEGSRKKLEAGGWTCFAVSMGDEELRALCERIGRED